MNKKAIAAVGGLAAFGILTASAASLGGLTSSSLGADQTVIAACDTDGIALSYTNTYVASTNVYTTTQVIASGVNSSCAGKSYELSLENGTTLINKWAGTVSLLSNQLTINITGSVPAANITAAALVITG